MYQVNGRAWSEVFNSPTQLLIPRGSLHESSEGSSSGDGSGLNMLPEYDLNMGTVTEGE